MNYCSNCGSDKINWVVPKGDTQHRFVCSNCGMIHYQNPKVVVGCIPIWNNKILLCRRAIEPRKGFWNLPGGYLENGESLMEGAARETLEETNAKVDVRSLLSIFTIPTINQVMMHFLAELKSDEFSTTEETSELRLYSPEELPWKQLAFNSNDFALKAYLDYTQTKDAKVKMFTYRK